MSVGKERYKQAAISIANKIGRDAIWHGDMCNWTGLSIEDGAMGKSVYTRALTPDFYDGVAGVAFFLLQVHRILPQPVILKTIKGAMQKLMTGESAENNFLNGFYQGRAGVIYVLKMAAQILHNDKMNKEAEKRLSDLLVSAEGEGQADIISGLAGIILFLLYLYRLDNIRHELLSYAVKLGKLLLEKADKSDRGYSWKTIDIFIRNLTGYAHGASGIATSFFELYAITKDEDFLNAAKEAFRYENSFFNLENINWPDFRFRNSSGNPADEVCSLAWCHGAPGIGLARFRAFEITGDKKYFEDGMLATSVTRKNFSEENIPDYSLCHGLFGNALLLLKASSLSNDGMIIKEVTQLADHCIAKYISPDIPVPGGYHSSKESPCFMQGNSGMGYFFLQLYDPMLFPLLII